MGIKTCLSLQRNATHAGTWYSKNERDLKKELDELLREAKYIEDHEKVRAIISPHAGYSYSGRVAVSAFKQISEIDHSGDICIRSDIGRVIIFGPLHRGNDASYEHPLWASGFSIQKTPFHNLQVDVNLRDTLNLPMLPNDLDLAEHSIEMMYPILSYLIGDRNVLILPIYVTGRVTEKDMAILIKNCIHEDTVFVFSSDFCHWGRRFGYTYIEKNSNKPISAQIEELDKRGMDILQSFSLKGWREYLLKTKNTICGNIPLEMMIAFGNHWKDHSAKLHWISYAQSNQARSSEDSSVSYAAGCIIVED